jgi:hypothetical protein
MLDPSTENAREFAAEGTGEPLLLGQLHAYIAFDWGEDINLDVARALAPAETHDLPRRRRTPSSIGYRPPPLRFGLAPVRLPLVELGEVTAVAEATVFDFAAVSVALHASFQADAGSLLRLAGSLADPGAFVRAARASLQPLHQRLLPAIQDPLWQEDLSEEYFVFHLPGGAPLPPVDEIMRAHGSWLAGILRLESNPLSPEEINEALRLFIRYSPQDLFVPDWAAALLVDRDCEETLQIIEFANLQLLEYRYIDQRLDDNLASAYTMIHGLAKSRLPFWRSHGRSLRALGELKVEANGLFERTGNALKLTGDQYLARVYRLLAARFHLEAWEESVRRKLEVAEGVYQVVSDQTDTYRSASLELIVVLLIVVEVLLAVFRH